MRFGPQKRKPRNPRRQSSGARQGPAETTQIAGIHVLHMHWNACPRTKPVPSLLHIVHTHMQRSPGYAHPCIGMHPPELNLDLFRYILHPHQPINLLTCILPLCCNAFGALGGLNQSLLYTKKVLMQTTAFVHGHCGQRLRQTP